MSYIDLGSQVTTAVSDPTGFNTGNFTNVFDQAKLGAKVAYFEIYALTVTKLTGLPTVTGYVNSRVRTSTQLGGANADWDPCQPILMTQNDDFYLCWNIVATGTAPIATVWLRYDPAIQPSVYQPSGG